MKKKFLFSHSLFNLQSFLIEIMIIIILSSNLLSFNIDNALGHLYMQLLCEELQFIFPKVKASLKPSLSNFKFHIPKC